MTDNTLDNQEQTYKCVACGHILKTADPSSIRCPKCSYKGLELFEESSPNTLDKLEWLTRIAHNSHYSCEYRQDNTPRTSVKCAGCSHSRESYEQSIRDVLNYVTDREKKMLESDLKEWQEVADRLKYFFMKIDGSYEFDNSADGDIFRMIHKILETKRQRAKEWRER